LILIDKNIKSLRIIDVININNSRRPLKDHFIIKYMIINNFPNNYENGKIYKCIKCNEAVDQYHYTNICRNTNKARESFIKMINEKLKIEIK